ncbi:MAG: cbb3-type cytochrome oxidase assembly protein [Limisphaerales bacterium]
MGFLIAGGCGRIKGTTSRVPDTGDETPDTIQALAAVWDAVRKQPWPAALRRSKTVPRVRLMMHEAPASTTAELLAWTVLTALAVGGFCWAVLRGQFADLDRAARLPLAGADYAADRAGAQGSSTRIR